MIRVSIVISALLVILNPAIRAEAGSFQIVENKTSVPICFDEKDEEVVGIAARALAKDIQMITGTLPSVVTNQNIESKTAILIGTAGKSRLIDGLVKEKVISSTELEGKWETFLITVIDKPGAGMDKAIVIAGSDPRGTAFGVFELSRLMGVSPWVYWADVLPAPRKELAISLEQTVKGPPAVKFRGIFLNDEDWGLQPWAAKNIDTDVKDIGPKTYALIFELMLRLKANYIWPAMHGCTRAFFHYKGNPEVARKYSIFVGSSHCEPMLRNNVDEWYLNFAEEYKRKPGDWRYDTNKEEIHKYWDDRIKQVGEIGVNAVFTVGMRGIHDGDMPGPKTTEGKVKLLNQVLVDQRVMLSKHLGAEATTIPQIFVPYKEVLHLYRQGVELPEDVTLVWADDNHGYIRKLSNPDEQKRSGRSGVYYHLSYWGKPQDYLWLSSTAPALISYEMSKAYAYGADRLWVFNVGDIKPAEMETEFAMDLAWDPVKWSPEKASGYARAWATRTFGAEYAEQISEIKAAYYTLAASGKPEHMNKVYISSAATPLRIAAYQDIMNKVTELKKRIPSHLQDAFYQLLYYPVMGAGNMNLKHIYARQCKKEEAEKAFEDIKRLTRIYNREIAGGKWSEMMNMNPRRRGVFKKPDVEEPEPPTTAPPKKRKPPKPTHPVALSSLQFDKKQLYIIPNLGAGGESLSRIQFDGPSFEPADATSAPFASIKLKLLKGQRTVELFCLPTHAIHEGRGLRAAVTIDDHPCSVLDFHAPSKTSAWNRNVIRGFSKATTTSFEVKEQEVTLKLYLLDPGLAITRIIVH